MSIAFYDRPVAAATFRRYRRTWSRPAAWTLTLLHCARDPDVRFTAALALVVYGIPPNGVLRKEQRERLGQKQAA
jgi:hypothetical protein